MVSGLFLSTWEYSNIILGSRATRDTRGYFGTRGAIWDDLQRLLYVDIRIVVMNSDFDLRFGACAKS